MQPFAAPYEFSLEATARSLRQGPMSGYRWAIRAR